MQHARERLEDDAKEVEVREAGQHLFSDLK